MQNGSNDSIQLFGSTSSNSKESRSWMRERYPHNHHFATDGGSPSDTSLIQPWTPPPTQRVNMDDYETSSKRCAKSGPLCFTPTLEGTSMLPNSRGSTSSRSDYSEFEHSGKLHVSTPRNFPNRRSFMSKPIHPLSFPVQAPTLEANPAPLGAGLLENDTFTLQSNACRLSSDSSSVDLADISEQCESDHIGGSANPCEVYKCGVCHRLLSQRSPWSSRRIIKSGDMPVTGVLFCHHVFHAECLEQTTPKSHRSDPPCPICAKVEGEHSPIFLGTYNSFPRLRAFREDESSKSWGCVQIGDCVEGAINRNTIKKNLSLKGKMSKDFFDKPKKSGSYPLNFFGRRIVDYGAGGCSKTSAGCTIKK